MSNLASRQPRIPEQQGVGQTLPPVPVGIDTTKTPPLPPGALPIGSQVQVQKYKVIIHNFIAEGGFAHVYLARIEGKSGFVVLKRVAVPDTERLKTVEKEIAFMKRLGDHKNITRYYASRIDPMPTGGFQAFILMEYCPGGGVIDLMNRRLQQRLTEPEVLKIFGDVCEALAYMHYCTPPVLHRDLKVENILILSQDHYKLCDFGSAALSKGNYAPTTLQEVQKIEDDIQRHTTLQYRAPEMIDVYQKRPINEKADIWALGVLLYKLCYYTTPFEEQGQLAILNARFTIPAHPMFSDGLKRLIVSLLQEDQNRRPDIYQVVKAVSDLRGVPCPIRNIYSTQSSPEVSTPPKPASNESPSAIFEKLPSPPKELPEIVPMRRGRPTRHAHTASQTQVWIKDASTPELDPFEALQQQSKTDSQAAAQADEPPPTPGAPEFDPFDPRHVAAVASKQTSTIPSNQTPPKENATADEQQRPVLKNTVSSNIEARFQALKMHASRDFRQEDNSSSSSSSSNTNSSPENSPSPPPQQRPPSIAAASTPEPVASISTPRSSSLATSNVTTTISYRPPPPPKPARFRVSKVAAPSSEPSSSPSAVKSNRATGSESATTTTLPRPPSISDFEDKFPTIEELYKRLSVNGSDLAK
ncbi:hypothetical protein VTP01DRAFT_10383 [Rhizomucor pusillus]|uniref:uncharacterized protein n=1 Tax=Rhizomucor pusillus TaxID=4840 RepID=UPI0037437860